MTNTNTANQPPNMCLPDNSILADFFSFAEKASSPFSWKIFSASSENNTASPSKAIRSNSADTGLRIFNSIEHYDLNIAKAVFTRGESTHTCCSDWVVFFWE
jgi:hypothetical protein